MSIFAFVKNQHARRRQPGGAATRSDGFTLVEMLIAMFILTFGLLAVGQLMYVAMASSSLARSKGSAAVVAQDKLEYLADLYRQNPSHADLTLGNRGPELVQLTNPVNGTILNRYSVAWVVSTVSDPRPGKVLGARRVTVTATPVSTAGSANSRTSLNKVVSVSGIFSARVQ